MVNESLITDSFYGESSSNAPLARRYLINGLSSAARRKRNALNLHWNALGQLLDRNAAPRRLMRKELLICTIHLGEVCHVVEEYCGLPTPEQSDLLVSIFGELLVDARAGTLTLTTLSMLLPAASSTAMMLLQHCSV